MANPEATPEKQRSRLIDHFKRAYQIVAGLAITVACSKVFQHGSFDWSDPALPLFGSFFVTVVPIFHGGDRSLDVKYLPTAATGTRRIAYIWDVYMLLITAIFFVKMAQAIPGQGGQFFVATSSAASPELFYSWMAAMLAFDVFVLLIDWYKSTGDNLPAYMYWIAVNAALAALCWLLPGAGLGEELTGVVIFAAAFARTVGDYYWGDAFLFP